jgi:hypothetical protein
VYLVLVRNSWLEVGVTNLLSILTDGRLPSAFAGLAVMFALFPLPGYVAQRTQKVQVEKMHKVGGHFVYWSVDAYHNPRLMPGCKP